MPGSIKITSIDDDKRFKECPVCGNICFSFKACFCKICGYYLFNGCTNFNDGHDPRVMYYNCGEPNVPNALFCEFCGSKTMLYELMEKSDYAEDTMREVAIAAE